MNDHRQLYSRSAVVASLVFLAAQRVTPGIAAPTPAKSAASMPTTRQAADARSRYKLVLTDGDRMVVRTRGELGIGFKGNEVVVDKAVLKEALGRLRPAFAQEAEGAKPYLFHGKIEIDPGSDARALNVPTTAERIADEVTKNPAAKRFTVALDKKSPDLTPDRLKGITGILSTFQTITSADTKRNHNIALASSRIDGRLLSPGETFSLNDTVGKRTHQTGFLTAHVFVNAEIVPGVGGGVSQVTGTLFNAAALAGLKIVEVNPHSRPVAYLPLGRDATVAYGDEDLKFKNDTKAPVYLDYHLQGRRLRATLFGAPVPGRAISLRPKVQHLGPGKIDAELYRVIKERGKVVAKERLFTHHYRWDPTKKAAP